MPTPKLFQILAWHCGQNFKFCSKVLTYILFLCKSVYILIRLLETFIQIHAIGFLYLYLEIYFYLLTYLITLHFPWMKTVLIFFGHNFETPAIVLGWLAFKSLESLEKIVEASDGWWLGGICVKSGWCIFHC